MQEVVLELMKILLLVICKELGCEIAILFFILEKYQVNLTNTK